VDESFETNKQAANHRRRARMTCADLACGLVSMHTYSVAQAVADTLILRRQVLYVGAHCVREPAFTRGLLRRRKPGQVHSTASGVLFADRDYPHTSKQRFSTRRLLASADYQAAGWFRRAHVKLLIQTATPGAIAQSAKDAVGGGLLALLLREAGIGA